MNKKKRERLFDLSKQVEPKLTKISTKTHTHKKKRTDQRTEYTKAKAQSTRTQEKRSTQDQKRENKPMAEEGRKGKREKRQVAYKEEKIYSQICMGGRDLTLGRL